MIKLNRKGGIYMKKTKILNASALNIPVKKSNKPLAYDGNISVSWNKSF